ncbi:MAG TPA: hypothetical protein PLW86_14955 [Rhodocyclaceae bacterium]|nr:hypothetical protein [Rhodocyclaceae bacterium]
MWLLRLLAVILIIAIGAGLLIYTLTGDRRYLHLAWRLFRYGVVIGLAFFALMILERVAVLPI